MRVRGLHALHISAFVAAGAVLAVLAAAAVLAVLAAVIAAGAAAVARLAADRAAVSIGPHSQGQIINGLEFQNIYRRNKMPDE